MAVVIERALRAYGFFDAYELSPPDGDARPTGFAVCKNDEPLFLVEVTEW